jgi:EAL domain-containing protein (putative c-di-GMP-specific phosphodiesterase class I)
MGLASSLHLDVTAEGVERTEQARALLDEGCRRGQGYLYSPPVPAAEFLAVCRRQGFRGGQRAPAGSEVAPGGW